MTNREAYKTGSNVVSVIHVHPIYKALHCGADSQIYTTDFKHVDCPLCAANVEKLKEK